MQKYLDRPLATFDFDGWFAICCTNLESAIHKFSRQGGRIEIEVLIHCSGSGGVRVGWKLHIICLGLD